MLANTTYNAIARAAAGRWGIGDRAKRPDGAPPSALAFRRASSTDAATSSTDTDQNVSGGFIGFRLNSDPGANNYILMRRIGATLNHLDVRVNNDDHLYVREWTAAQAVRDMDLGVVSANTAYFVAWWRNPDDGGGVNGVLRGRLNNGTLQSASGAFNDLGAPTDAPTRFGSTGSANYADADVTLAGLFGVEPLPTTWMDWLWNGGKLRDPSEFDADVISALDLRALWALDTDESNTLVDSVGGFNATLSNGQGTVPGFRNW